MTVIVILAGFFVSIAVDSWIPFGVAAIIAAGMQWAATTFLHQHMHKLYEGEEDERGIKTIE
jgi:nitrogen fixation/metabolism regulation signal transduction histidine kinase